MTDKKTFGSFIKAKRIEKQYSQKELAELLYITEGAVSKWERGVSYPDITLISDICRVLEISEHEFITASTDTDTRRLKQEARRFRIIRSAWFWVPTICYAVALVVCFICNLAIDQTLSWFFVVLSALLCADTFIPTVTGFFASRKLLVFAVSTYLSICLLLFTCAVYTDGFSWFLTACIGVLIGYELLFVPMILSKLRCRFVLSFSAALGLTLLLLCNLHAMQPFQLGAAVLMACYGFAPVIGCAVICTLRLDACLKTGACILLGSVCYYFTGYVSNALFGLQENHYQVDFGNWQQCVQGNVHCICLASFLLIGAIFSLIGLLRIARKR